MFADVSGSFGPDIRKGLNVESAELMLQEKKNIASGTLQNIPMGIVFQGGHAPG